MSLSTFSFGLFLCVLGACLLVGFLVRDRPNDRSERAMREERERMRRQRRDYH